MVFADANYGTGGAGGGGTGDPQADSYYSCYMNFKQCPRWIKVTKSVYNQLVREKRYYGEYSFPECTNDEYVIIAGNQRYRDGTLQIRNMKPRYDSNGEEYASPDKSTFEFTSVATSIYSGGITEKNLQAEWHDETGSWNNPYNSDEERAQKTFFADRVEGKNYTYYELLNSVINSYMEANPSGSSDDIAVFCDSMVSEPDPVYYTRSNVSSRRDATVSSYNAWVNSTYNTIIAESRNANGAIIGATDRTGKVGDTFYITFSHNIYADKGDAGNVSYTVNRTVGDYSGFGSRAGVYTVTIMGKNDSNYPNASSGGISSGTTNIGSRQQNGYYMADPINNASGRPYTAIVNGGQDENQFGWFVMRDYLTVKFEKEGTYNFCEEITAGGAKSTACSKIIVVRPQDSECSAWLGYTDYNNSGPNVGYTDVLSGVKVSNGASNFSEWILSNGDWSWTSNPFEYKSRNGFSQRAVYAKPGDTIFWQHCYYPGVQKVLNSNPTIKNKVPNPRYKVSIDSSKGNGFTGSNNDAKDIFPGKGNIDIRRYSDSFTVTSGANSKTGMTLQEGIAANEPSYIRVSGSNINNTDSRRPSRIKDSAAVKIPYNFTNTTTVSIDTTKSYVYAGETASIKASVRVGTRKNDTTNGTYATKVDQAEARLIVYTSNTDQSGASGKTLVGFSSLGCNTDSLSGYNGGSCNDAGSLGRNGGGLNARLNGAENTNGSESDNLNNTYNVLDVNAGTYFCAVMAVYPYQPSGDTDAKNLEGNTPWRANKSSYAWYVSSPSCKIVAKKPSLQVWGGGLYTSGNINIDSAKKRVVAGTLDYSGTRRGAVTFGTWVEQNIMANGLVNIASGASTGKPGLTNKTYGGLGGSYNSSGPDSVCDLSPLTMPNKNCTTLPGGSMNSMNRPGDKEELVGKFAGSDGGGGFEQHTVNRIDALPSFDDVKTHVYKNEGNIYIGGNLSYYGNTYTSSASIPKIIIYASGNINIGCHVTQIDAVLIAGGRVNTCANESGESPVVNARERSNQLRINGAVITNRLDANRTYGAGTGSNSGVPAEVINYDSSLYLWSSNKSDVSSSGKLETTYQVELAPRL